MLSRTVILAAVLTSKLLLSQTFTATLKIDVANVVEYQVDISDPQQFASSPNATVGVTPKNFGTATIIGDIVAVNGQAVKGTYVGRSRGIQASPTPYGSAAITDITRAALREQAFEILKTDGTAIGTILSMGLSGGPAPPGAPSSGKGNCAIVGGTGAYLGARGQVNVMNGPGRIASVAENPSNRRTIGGSAISFYVQIIPMFVPQVVVTDDGPAVTHLDYTVVTPSNPASPGEVLIVYATGLGPVTGVDPGTQYPADPPAPVNSPVLVSVDGEPAELLGAVGYPGAIDAYQINIRVPMDVPIGRGKAVLQLTAAWVSGSPLLIDFQ
ncbi:MAG TPA: hypothetical protein VKU01_08905 [Bryobacteraceae bacterium]|nr:hypothetical protein [Bryobacteraceae bacterium]